MSSSTMVSKITCVLVLTLVVAAPHVQGITCGQVVTSLLPCLNYLKNGGTVPTACCDGVKSLNSSAKTTPDRKQACECIKEGAKAYDINYSYGSELPGKCGVSLGMKISASTDCSKVH